MISISRLKQIPLFAALSKEALEQVATLCAIQATKKGETLFQHGDKREAFFVVLSGQVHIYRVFHDEPQTLAILDANEFAVETALVHHDLRHEHFAEVLEGGELLIIEGKNFAAFRKDHPDVANILYGEMIVNLTSRLHHANNKIATIFTTGKIASTYDDLDHLTDLLLDTILGIIKAKRAIFVLFDPLQGKAIIRDAKGYRSDQEIKNLEVPLNQDPILGPLYQSGRDLLITEEQFKQEKSLHTPYASRTMLGTPLRAGDKVIGAIVLGDKEGETNFSHNNQILLNIIARQVVLAVATAQKND